MDALEHYVKDCEAKRRRMRDRPSDLVVSQLRWLLDYLKTDRGSPPRDPSDEQDPPGAHEGTATA